MENRLERVAKVKEMVVRMRITGSELSQFCPWSVEL